MKAQKALQNDGHTSALRRLPPAEREKFKQCQEAQANSLDLCPEETRAYDKSVPYCAYVISLTKGKGKKKAGQRTASFGEEPPAQAPPPPPRSSLPISERELVEDDQLVELKRDDEEQEAAAAASPKAAKKTAKGKKNKGQALVLDWGMPPMQNIDTGDDETTTATSTATVAETVTPTTSRPAPVGAARPAAPQTTAPGKNKKQSPSERAEKVNILVSTTGCSELRASQLLEEYGWDLERAGDAVFEPEPSAWASAVARTAPRQDAALPKQQQQQLPGSPQEQQARDQAESQHVQSRDDQQSNSQLQATNKPINGVSLQHNERNDLDSQRGGYPVSAKIKEAPKQPPPPRLPSGWQAVWAEEHMAYYFWETTSGKTTWDAPALEEASTETSRQQSLISQVQNIAGLDREKARALLEENEWNVERSIRILKEREDARKAQEAAQRKAEREAEEQRRAEQESSKVDVHPELVCTRHWQPKAGIQGCLRIFHGQRVRCSWTEGPTGWAYVVFLDDPNTVGYVPQAILTEATRAGISRALGEDCPVLEAFVAPEEVRGYLSVSPGDTVTVLHPVSEDGVWAYCQQKQQQSQSGWLPECVLGNAF